MDKKHKLAAIAYSSYKVESTTTTKIVILVNNDRVERVSRGRVIPEPSNYGKIRK